MPPGTSSGYARAAREKKARNPEGERRLAMLVFGVDDGSNCWSLSKRAVPEN